MYITTILTTYMYIYYPLLLTVPTRDAQHDSPDPQTRADTDSSSETEASGVQHKVPDLPDHISSRDEGKKNN